MKGCGFIFLLIMGRRFQFGHAIDQSGNYFTVALLNLLITDFSIFDRIMKDCRNNGISVQAKACQYLSDRNRMRDIRLP